MTIGIIGADGFIGKHLVKTFSKSYSVVKINRENYQSYHRAKFDILINANGNSKKHWANNHPAEDYKASVESVYNSTRDFRFSKYIFLSSRDAENDKIHKIYGYNKFIAERLVQKYCRNYSIVRLPAVIGRDSKKGIVHDIWHGNTIYLTKQSTLVLMPARVIAEQLLSLFDELEEFERFYPSLGITVEQIGGILEKDIMFEKDMPLLNHELYECISSSRRFKSSAEYLKNIYYEGME